MQGQRNECQAPGRGICTGWAPGPVPPPPRTKLVLRKRGGRAEGIRMDCWCWLEADEPSPPARTHPTSSSLPGPHALTRNHTPSFLASLWDAVHVVLCSPLYSAQPPHSESGRLSEGTARWTRACGASYSRCRAPDTAVHCQPATPHAHSAGRLRSQGPRMLLKMLLNLHHPPPSSTAPACGSGS